jgi:hypothetical protein
MSNQTGSDDRADGKAGVHLADLEDGAGCTEIWDHLSKHRAADD